MVGTGRFELPTPRTPSECSTRLSHVPTRSSRLGRAGLLGVSIESTPARGRCARLPIPGLQLRRRHLPQCDGGTYSLGSADPLPKKNSSICSTRNCWAWGVQGCRRYSFKSIFWRSTHSDQACLETFL